MEAVIFVAGARPNFVKIAPILKAAHGAAFQSVLVHTGQHYDHLMSGVFFEQLGIPTPDVHLEVGSSSHGVQTGRIMVAFEEYLYSREVRPAGIVVVGDVNSTMACALVGTKLGIPVAHVEAGLRSFDRTMPEEINRVVTDSISDLLLVSEPSGLDNLAREGVDRDRIRYVGNVMIDTLVEQLPAARALCMPGRMGLQAGAYAVVTLHRPSNVDVPHRLRELVELIETLSKRLPVLFPIHPRTRAKLVEHHLMSRIESAGVRTCEPLGYREFLGLVSESRIAITDSGGIQEETVFLGVPCVTLRNTTERPATLADGANLLAGESVAYVRAVIEQVLARDRPRASLPIDGWDGCAAQRVVASLTQAWGLSGRQ